MRHIEPNHPHPEKGQIRVYEEGESIPDIRSSKQGSIKDVTYFELENFRFFVFFLKFLKMFRII